MRYIRTKYGRIFEVLEEDKQFYYIGYPNEVGLALWGKLAKDVIKEAGTIEELCDEFVGIDTQGHYIIHNNEFVEGARIIPLEKVNYYGAIWTNKGLIYVAKMNEKGVFELI